MRITEKQLAKSNERKNVVIFILIELCFLLAIIVSWQYVEIKKTNDKILKSTNEIIKILTIGE